MGETVVRGPKEDDGRNQQLRMRKGRNIYLMKSHMRMQGTGTFRSLLVVYFFTACVQLTEGEVNFDPEPARHVLSCHTAGTSACSCLTISICSSTSKL